MWSYWRVRIGHRLAVLKCIRYRGQKNVIYPPVRGYEFAIQQAPRIQLAPQTMPLQYTNHKVFPN